MYEHLRNDFAMKLYTDYGKQDISKILSALDSVVKDYEISEKTTALTVVEDQMPKELKIYFASKKLEGLSENTLILYRLRLRAFFNEIGCRLQDIDTNTIRLFLAEYQMRTGITNRTLDKYRQILNGFFDWCVNEDYIAKNPCKNIKEFKYEVEPRHALTRYQLELVRRSCKTKRDLAIVDMLYSTGCRVSELVNIKFEDIDNDKHTVHIVGKGRKHNTIRINDVARISLNEYLKERKSTSEYVFTSYYKPYRQITTRCVELMFSEIGKELNIKITPHIIRHTTATLALQGGMDITQVQKLLNHSSVKTTQIYAETAQDDMLEAQRRYVV